MFMTRVDTSLMFMMAIHRRPSEPKEAETFLAIRAREPRKVISAAPSA